MDVERVADRLRRLCGHAPDGALIQVSVGEILSLLSFLDEHATCEDDSLTEAKESHDRGFDAGRVECSETLDALLKSLDEDEFAAMPLRVMAVLEEYVVDWDDKGAEL